MVQAGKQLTEQEVAELQIQNEQLKATIEIMRQEMEQVLKAVRDKGQQPAKPGAEWLAENKDTVQALQTKLNFAYADLQKLKDERD